GGRFLPSAQGEAQVAYAASEIAAMRGSANFSAQLTSDIRAFYAPRAATWPSDDFASWSYDGSI
ncbi:MAG: hypothetical protein ACR2QF_11040, partial [Geminicoccaceae bacterium]